ncbi:hypothetical protein Plo01_37640 [Planobispora longispora]|uniref:Uncharacterized protein n=2 Tax=Planobispora longispora TaxID=28887 RepID=A0A8J3RMF5_9ACTN|nr:hypothetical protein Plo01_37640 [Planobispora longispora]
MVTATGVLIAGRAAPEPGAARAEAATVRLAWEQGACVERESGRFELAACGEADGKVISLVGAEAADCPVETDELVRVRPLPGAGGTHAQAVPRSPEQGRTACVRSLRPPHPGDPGGGGGTLRAGDCLALRGGERPCSAPGWYGKVLAVVDRADACPARALDALVVGEREVACLGGGGRMLRLGDCVARPESRLVSREALVKAPCGSARSWAQVTGRAATRGRCPEVSDRYLRVREPGVQRPVTCLRRTALHGSP